MIFDSEVFFFLSFLLNVLDCVRACLYTSILNLIQSFNGNYGVWSQEALSVYNGPYQVFSYDIRAQNTSAVQCRYKLFFFILEWTIIENRWTPGTNTCFSLEEKKHWLHIKNKSYIDYFILDTGRVCVSSFYGNFMLSVFLTRNREGALVRDSFWTEEGAGVLTSPCTLTTSSW